MSRPQTSYTVDGSNPLERLCRYALYTCGGSFPSWRDACVDFFRILYLAENNRVAAMRRIQVRDHTSQLAR